MTFKAKSIRPSNQELLSTVGRVAAENGQLPTAAEVTTIQGRPGKEAQPTRRSSGPTVLVNFKATLPFAKLIAEVSGKEGGVRRMMARMLKEAGHEVPEQDLKPTINRRVYD